MRLSLPKVLKVLVLTCAGIVLGVIALSFAFASTLKSVVMRKLGFGNAYALSDSSCTLPASQKKSDVYYVSCGGFF